MSINRFITVPCLIAATVAGAARAASAANFSFSPTSIETTAQDRNGTVTLVNASDEPVRFETAAMRWDQGLDGKMNLSPTDDLLVFPSILTLAPHEKRLLRVTVLTPPGDREKTYRVQVTEIPEFRGVNTAGASVTVLSQLELPVFYEPQNATPMPAHVIAANARGGTFSFSIVNEGPVRFRVDHLTVTGMGNGERAVFTRPLEGWYILAGGRRDFSVSMPHQWCDRVHAIQIAGDAGAHISQTVSVPPGACHA